MITQLEARQFLIIGTSHYLIDWIQPGTIQYDDETSTLSFVYGSSNIEINNPDLTAIRVRGLLSGPDMTPFAAE